MANLLIDMAKWICCVLVAISCCGELSAQQTKSPSRPTIELARGQWFDGHEFKPRTMFIEKGMLKNKRPNKVDQVLDLHHGYVVPPYGEAHTWVDRPTIGVNIRLDFHS